MAAEQMRMKGIQTKAAFSRCTEGAALAGLPGEAPIRENPMTRGMVNWAMVTPKLHSPLIPSAVPWACLGNQRLITPIEVAKFAPAIPVSAAQASRTQYGVAGFFTARPVARQGNKSRKVTTA